MSRQSAESGDFRWKRVVSSADLCPMTVRTSLLITALLLCHQVPARALFTRQLLAGRLAETQRRNPQADTKKPQAEASHTPCATEAESEASQETTICAMQQEKIGEVYRLRGDVEIHYRNYVLRADEVTYDSDTGNATAAGHFRLDGGPNDEHIRASHGSYNLTTETGRFYDVTGTTGFRLQGMREVLTSSAPFSFTGKMVEKTSSDHYVVYDGNVTTCELPKPMWQFEAHKVTVDVAGNASIYRSSFWLHGFPIFWFPYATHPVNREARHSGFLIPTATRSSVKGNVVGDEFYWAINRSLDATIGGEYYSTRGWSQRGELRARPSDTSYFDLNFFGVIDRGIAVPTSTGPQLLREGGQEVRVLSGGNFYGFRAVSNVDYLSSFLFRLAFNDVFTQAINSEVKSQAFLAKDFDGYSFSGMLERYQNFFQLANSDGTLTNPPVFQDVQIWHTPSLDASTVDRDLGHSFFWAFDASSAGLSRSEPGFSTANLLERYDFNPEISLPLLYRGWSVRPALAIHETYYSERLVNGVTIPDATNRQALDGSVEIRPPTLERVFNREVFGRKLKHVIEPLIVYRLVTGVNDFANILHFDERDILSNTHEVEYGFTTRLYAKRKAASITECDTQSMNALAVGSPAPEQTVPWGRSSTLQNQPCVKGPEVREVATWEVFQKYFLDPTFGGALVTGQRNVFTTTQELTGIAFLTKPRHLSPLVSRMRFATGRRTNTEWDLDYDFQLGRINSSTLLVNYNLGPVTVGGGDAFLEIPQAQNTGPIPVEGTCGPSTANTAPTCKFQQFRVALGYGGLNRRGFSSAASFGLDAEIKQLQFATAQTTYNWDCCGMTLEYRRYAIANVRNENLFRFTFTLANIGSFGNLRRQERLY
jgi:LPS-assembly protein